MELGHTLLTKLKIRVKNAKENIRDSIEETQSLGRYCNVSRNIAVVSETWEVYPSCELLDYSLGNLRDQDYDLMGILHKSRDKFLKAHHSSSCHCDWGCAQNVPIVSNPKFWPKVLWKNLAGSGK